MVISGNTLPALPELFNSAADQRRFDQQQPALNRFRESAQQNRQQTVEFIFRGEIEDQIFTDGRVQNSKNQQIDPANQQAIFSYVDTQTISIQRPERQGRLLDIFI